ncbi:hypothetical protein Tco_0245349 [Tanacetum coccineum]
MTGDRSRLMNFVKKFIGTVRFGNAHFGAIIGYGDYVVGDSVISRIIRKRRNLSPKRQCQGLHSKRRFERRNRDSLSGSSDNANLSKAPDVSLAETVATLENLGKLQPRADIGIFIGYAPSRKGYRIYNKRTRQIMETIHVQFDELTEQMAPVQSSPGPAPNLLTPGPISSGLVPNPAPAIPYVPPTNKELEMLFQPMFDEYFNPPGIRQDPIPNVAQDPVIPTGPSVSISINLDAPSGSYISSPLDHHSSSVHHGVAGEQYAEVNPFAAADPGPFVNVFALDPTSEASSSGEIMMSEPN